MTVEKIGTVATSNPASPDVIDCSAVPIKIHGIDISNKAYTAMYFQPLIAVKMDLS